ncbi:MAG: hypothetical protein SF182_07230 [Deltaproteobacteria bacterium]|nr:hypothetical protein [Deltaproteobacteria bacterium]
MSRPDIAPHGYEDIFTSYITLKDGRILTAASCGLKAFKIRVKKGARKQK